MYLLVGVVRAVGVDGVLEVGEADVNHLEGRDSEFLLDVRVQRLVPGFGRCGAVAAVSR
jgi:hypothetical protein